MAAQEFNTAYTNMLALRPGVVATGNGNLVGLLDRVLRDLATLQSYPATAFGLSPNDDVPANQLTSGDDAITAA